MKIIKTIVPLLLALSLFGCGKPIPPEKSAYVGVWQGNSMYLRITKNGSVRYKRVRGATTTSVNGPIKDFDGNNFEVGVGPMSTTFIVSKPPFQDGGQWKMVVDDVELTRTTQW